MSLIALGVTGGIGAYKAVEICRGLQQQGHEVVVIMTHAATRFVGPLTFEAITQRPVITSQWKPGANADIEHISIATDIKLLLVAPCTANIIGKFANGIADDFLTSLYLATTAPVMLAPAMNTNMFSHAAVRKNIATLHSQGVKFVEPGEGYLACGWIGKGRLAEPEKITNAVASLLAPSTKTLRGKRVLITAGPTYEDIDPVRFLGNRSSGRMGFEMAAEAKRRGAHVILVAGPSTIEPVEVDMLERVRSAAQMHEAVLRLSVDVDIVVMAAAVADYTLKTPSSEKLIKQHETLVLEFSQTADILAELGQAWAQTSSSAPVLVGFSAETNQVIKNARKKLLSKQIDLIVANDISLPDSGFDVDTNAVTIIGVDGEQEIPTQHKSAIASVIFDRIESILPTKRRLSPVKT